MKYWVLILVPTFLIFAAPASRAHNLVTFNGNTQSHQHVYRRQEYGKPLQQGHVAKSSGGNGSVLWGFDKRPEYGKLNSRRDGPIIGDHKSRATTTRGGNKYGSAVTGYGKPVQGYGKPVRNYGKPGNEK